MRRAVVIERDAQVRRSLEHVLEDAGYAVVGMEDHTLIASALQVSPFPLVVLFHLRGQQPDASALLQQLTLAVAGEGSMPHTLVVLSPRPQDLPRPLTDSLAQQGVSFVPEPYDRRTLLDAMEAAADRTALAVGAVARQYVAAAAGA